MNRSAGHGGSNDRPIVTFKNNNVLESLRGLMDKASASYTPDRIHDCDSRGLRVRVPSEVLFLRLDCATE